MIKPCCIEEANGKHQKELDSLLTLRFQTFNQAQIMTRLSKSEFLEVKIFPENWTEF